MTKPFTDKRRLAWLGGIVALILGVILAAIILPMRADPPGAGGVDVTVPKMQNVPPEAAPKMRFETEPPAESK